MTVQEAIDKLSTLPDKSLPLRYYDGEWDCDHDIYSITLEKVDNSFIETDRPHGERYYRLKVRP